MRGALLGIFIVIACGGETAPIDAGADVKPACFSDPRTDADRQCTTTSDCAVVDYVADCCGSVIEHGVRVDRVNAIHEAEVAANTGCPVCKCPPQPTVDESAQSGNAYLAACESGLCTAHAQ